LEISRLQENQRALKYFYNIWLKDKAFVFFLFFTSTNHMTTRSIYLGSPPLFIKVLIGLAIVIIVTGVHVNISKVGSSYLVRHLGLVNRVVNVRVLEVIIVKIVVVKVIGLVAIVVKFAIIRRDVHRWVSAGRSRQIQPEVSIRRRLRKTAGCVE